ncbi:hypothetical protein [Agromyces bauzanensis]
MTHDTTQTGLSRADRTGMYATVALAAGGIVIVAWLAITRLVEVLPGRDVPVLVPFVDEAARLPIGPGGAMVDVAVDQAIVTVPRPAPATQFALVAEPLVHGLSIIAGIALLAMFCWNLAGGRAFSRGNVRLVMWSGGVLMLGWLVGTILTNMTVNGALSAVSEYTYDGVVFALNWVPFFAVLALGAIGAAFQIGERLQRDVTGLV